MVFSHHVSFCWSLNFLTKSVSLKFGSVRAVIMHAVSHRRFILITFLFVCFLVSRC